MRKAQGGGFFYVANLVKKDKKKNLSGAFPENSLYIGQSRSFDKYDFLLNSLYEAARHDPDHAVLDLLR